MIKIAHRGNTHGPSTLENNPDYIMSAISLGYDVEIDVWNIDDYFYLGHDKPEYLIDIKFLNNIANNLWAHCKNLEALDKLLMINNINCFWHENDAYTLTSKGYIWTYPRQICKKNSVLVHLDIPTKDILLNSIYGICSDYVGEF